MSDNNNNSNKFLFLAGIVTGAAAAIYLNTPHGKKVRNAIVEKADEYSTTVKDKATEVAGNARDKAQSVYDSASKSAKDAYNKASTSAKDALDSASSTIESVKERFIDRTEDAADAVAGKAKKKVSNLQRGVDKAKNKIKEETTA